MKRMNYKISLDYDDYFSNSLNLTASNIEVVGDAILFQTDNESIKYLDNNNIRYMLHYSKKGQVGFFLKHRSGIIVGILVVCFLVFFNSFRVSDIKFNSVKQIKTQFVIIFVDKWPPNKAKLIINKKQYVIIKKN